MSGLVIRDKNGEKLSYSGTQFEGLEDMGSRHLCVRTGSGAEDVVKYALTSKPLNDKYKALRMRIPDGASGKEAYIAQRYVESRTVSVSTSYTSSRSSQYISTKTLTTGSYTRVGTRTATRSMSQNPVYYFRGPALSSFYGSIRPVSTDAQINGSLSRTTYDNVTLSELGITGSYIGGARFASNFLESKTTTFTSSTMSAGTRELNVPMLIYKTLFKSTVGWDILSTLSASSFYNLFNLYDVKMSKVSSYTQTYASNVASSSATQTATASRTSEYTSSTSVSSTETFTSHNVDL